MNILFVFKSENFLAPIGLCMISAAARKAGHDCFLCEVNSQDVFERIAAVKPGIIAYSSSTGEVKHYLNLNRTIKARHPGLITVMGGPHPTFFPEVADEAGLDAICVGEGEGAFVDIINAAAAGKGLSGIANIRVPGQKKGEAVRGLVEDLDTLPFPDFRLLYDNTPMGKYPLKSIIASRGCPYDCTYCFNASWRRIYEGKGPATRRHSVEYLIDEIDLVKRTWPLSFVKFYDDIFTYRADDWLEKFSKLYPSRIGLPFFVLTRADLLTEDMVKLLKQAGCHTISMSIEAGNPRLRETLLNRSMTNEQIVRAHRLCDRYGIYTFTNSILGLPTATIANEIESVDLCIASRVTWSEFLIFHPYPATRLGQKTIDDGYYTPDYEKMHTSYMYRSPLNCFTEREKTVHMNLSVLGAVATTFPFLRTLIVRVLVYLPHNMIYTIAYYLTKMYVLRTRIYVTKTGFMNSVKIFMRSLRQEFFRHENARG
ncbi:MAG TPA: radical SAM protein [Candidatus Omnitrophota bacterium]|nr:radical SAM protein [Candidatus Omnitrophota bacterium]HQQ06642.1 radical SAM protein [Candidatus Omnitrophota bacterium]